MAQLKIEKSTHQFLGKHRIQEYDYGNRNEVAYSDYWKEMQLGRKNGGRDMGTNLEYLPLNYSVPL